MRRARKNSVWVELCTLRLGGRKAAHGLARGGTDAAVSALLEGRDCERLELGGVPLKAWRSTEVDAVLVARFGAPLLAHEGAVTRQEGQERTERLLDARHAPATVEFGTEKARFRLELEPGSLRLCRANAPLRRAPIDAWLAGWKVPPWLTLAAGGHAAHASTAAQLRAGGLVVRHWRLDDARASAHRISSGDWPGAEAQAWCAALPRDERVKAVRDLIADARALAADLAPLEDVLSESPRAGRAAALDWLLRRDDLECAAACFALRPSTLAAALARLDEAAFAAASCFPSSLSHPRLAALADSLGDEWWARSR